ncbi:MAG: histidine phosphatase family protein [Planctomycetota bacterium]
MNKHSLKLFAFLFLASAAIALPIQGDTTQGTAKGHRFLEPQGLLEQIRAGGHVIYFRHAQTEKDYADQVTADPNDGSTQRVLSETGWHQAKSIGAAFRDLNIPVGVVYSSEYFRAWQTADLAFGRYEKQPDLNFLPHEDYTAEQVEEMKRRMMPFLTAAPEAEKNTVIVGHDDPFEAATGIYPEPQGVAYVLKPDGDSGFSVVGRVGPEEWADMDASQ